MYRHRCIHRQVHLHVCYVYVYVHVCDVCVPIEARRWSKVSSLKAFHLMCSDNVSHLSPELTGIPSLTIQLTVRTFSLLQQC